MKEKPLSGAGDEAGHRGPEPQSHNGHESRLSFERLISDLSARFVSVKPEEMDGTIDIALMRILDFFDVDRVGLLGISPDGKKVFVTHAAYSEGTSRVSGEIDLAAMFPLHYKELSEGQTVSFARLEDLPPEAETDSMSYLTLGIRSGLDIPVFLGGRLVAIIVLNAVRKNRVWPEDFFPRLRLLGEIVVNALERRNADRALRESESRYSLATEAAGALPWEIDIASGSLWTTERAKDFFGFPAEGDLTLERFFGIVHPEDRDALRKAVADTVRSGKDNSAEYRVIRPDGSMLWILSRGMMYSFGQTADRMMGVSFDITDRIQAKEQLRHSISLLKAALESTADGILVVDRNGKITDFNDQFRRLWNIPPDVLADNDDGTALNFVTGQLKDPAQFIVKIRELYATPDAESFDVIEFTDGRVFERYSQPQKIDGRPVGRVWSFRDVTERRRAEDEIRKAYEEIDRLNNQLSAENTYLRREMHSSQQTETIIGRSDAIKYVHYRISQVAPMDTTVLIVGETGTGKGLVARTVHEKSLRRDRPMVHVNCAVLPANLIESELFGREKGAFTGAQTRQIGRFQLADKGTLFLDEIAELPVELQAKLLRVVETGEFERLGDPHPVKVDVRIIASTNRNLEEEIRKGRFREDLFYRLNVFPVTVPPLRERAEDIPLIVDALIERLNKRLGRSISAVPPDVIQALQRYPWPGNVRELENIIERAAIMCRGQVLQLAEQLGAVIQLATEGQEALPAGLADVERAHIRKTLDALKWKIEGPRGAAHALGMKPSTLRDRMKKLDIRRQEMP